MATMGGDLRTLRELEERARRDGDMAAAHSFGVDVLRRQRELDRISYRGPPMILADRPGPMAALERMRESLWAPGELSLKAGHIMPLPDPPTITQREPWDHTIAVRILARILRPLGGAPKFRS